MATKFLVKDINGYCLIHRYETHYRLSSMIFAIVTQIDFDGGMDEFIPISCNDEELGAAVKRCLNKTKIMDPKDLPFKGDKKKLKQLMTTWEKRAEETIGSNSHRISIAGGSCATCVQTKKITAFFNTNESPAGDFRSINENSPAYREFIVTLPARDFEIGFAARSCLDAVARDGRSAQ